ncbi:hypothetical protein Desaci_4391 [Desulfosporosinus acidiphilus SJ4]|uniref:Uncharacterized protein n=1 Tax=Desulfosporosinus acidiphilus (strain DSM 22704 / JCM 16185 / SJ4) TaxID=646529 RepID=I4DBR1_DESAJ|nr:hypothetical protein Desaci_4391 [Desulfosporosinus acidiphilus SJ4]
MPLFNWFKNGCSKPPLPNRPTSVSSEAWDYGFKRLVPILQSPPVGAGILAISFFFFIAFFSNILLAQVSLKTLGIAVTVTTFSLMAMVVLILFLL